MTNNNFPQRKPMRAEFHDYSGGNYFITICTRDKKHYFGEIYNDEMHFSPIGTFAHNALQQLSSHYQYIEVPLFVVMPNHIHAIIVIHNNRSDEDSSLPKFRQPLGVVVGGYKQYVTCYARRNALEFGWQPRYHDHIIRDIHDGNNIAQYITTNVARWGQDYYNIKL